MVPAIAALFLLLAIIVVVIVLKISSQVNERLNQMTGALQEAHKVIGQNLGNSTAIFGGIQEKLGRLEEANRQIYEVGKDISSLQELLRVPKSRGEIGETFLENLLSQVLPANHYSIQYRFKSADTVDAVIRLGDRLVPIDAKFSLENFQKMRAETDETARAGHRKKFIQDVKVRIDEIASKYILPAENTYDFGLMYIPAENVYYEIMVTEGLLHHSIARKVFPVSPTTLYTYLQVICLGLKGLKIEENAKAILKNLSTLSNEMSKFREDFSLLGGHLSNAAKKYDESQKHLERFSDKLTNIQNSESDS